MDDGALGTRSLVGKVRNFIRIKRYSHGESASPRGAHIHTQGEKEREEGRVHRQCTELSLSPSIVLQSVDVSSSGKRGRVAGNVEGA